MGIVTTYIGFMLKFQSHSEMKGNNQLKPKENFKYIIDHVD